jgi:hypothetical protein
MRWSISAAGAVALVCLAALAAPDARAQSNAPANAPAANAGLMPTPSAGTVDSRSDPTLAPVSPSRRNGVVLGVSPGIAFAGSSGYPNDPKRIGNPDYFSSSPLLVGWSSSFFLMGAFADYLSFGPMVSVATLENAKWKSTGWGIGFRAEFFPMVDLAPKLGDTSIFTQLGVGSTDLRAKGPYPDAGATQSFLGIGLHQEWRLGRMGGGHASGGPFVEYDVIHTDSVQRHALSVGLRVVWYGGRVRLDQAPPVAAAAR